MALRKEEFLFKKVFAKKAITEPSADQPFYQEPYTAGLSSYPTDIYSQIARLPNLAPSKWSAGAYSSGDIVWLDTGIINLCYVANTGTSATPPHADWTVFTPLKKIEEQEMSAVSGADNAFQHDTLKQTIPFSFGTSGYGYVFKKASGTQIAFGDNDWTFDTEAGTIYFNNDDLPSGVDQSSNLPTMSCFIYTGYKLDSVLDWATLGAGGSVWISDNVSNAFTIRDMTSTLSSTEHFTISTTTGSEAIALSSKDITNTCTNDFTVTASNDIDVTASNDIDVTASNDMIQTASGSWGAVAGTGVSLVGQAKVIIQSVSNDIEFRLTGNDFNIGSSAYQPENVEIWAEDNIMIGTGAFPTHDVAYTDNISLTTGRDDLDTVTIATRKVSLIGGTYADLADTEVDKIGTVELTALGTDNTQSSLLLGDGVNEGNLDVVAYKITLEADQSDTVTNLGYVECNGTFQVHRKNGSSRFVTSIAEDLEDDINNIFISQSHSEGNKKDTAESYSHLFTNMGRPHIKQVGDADTHLSYLPYAKSTSWRGQSYSSRVDNTIRVQAIKDPETLETPELRQSDCVYNYSTLGYSTQYVQSSDRIGNFQTDFDSYSCGAFGCWNDGGLHA